MIPLSTITSLARSLGRQFDADQVILFGSYARHQATEDSDVDLLVVTDRDPAAGHRLIADMRRAAAHQYPMPLDLVVRSRAAIEKWKSVPYTLIHEVLKDGSVLYDRRSG